MSDVKRYMVKCEWGYEHDTIEDDAGELVMWEDYATLRAENERLKGEVEGLKTQVEELADALNNAGYEIDALVGALEG